MRTSDDIHEYCAVFGVSLTNQETRGEAAGITYNGLLSLQHRGQEGAGIALVHQGHITCHKENGLVSEVFSGTELKNMPSSHLAVGHTRYGTYHTNKKENVGPFVTEYLTGRIATAHNGNITNADQLRKQLKSHGVTFDATCDNEVVSSFIAYHITQTNDTLEGVVKAAKLLQGAFSLIIACGDNKLIVVRDPNGFRPLCIGENGNGVAAASESCALRPCGFELERDVKPGEVILIEGGKIQSQAVRLHNKEANRGICIFEYVYFARQDSIIDGLSVYDARYNMGRVLAKECPADADIVCGVPDSGLDAAAGYSAESGIPLVSGFVKNRYIGRSFIYPTQDQRVNAVRLKLNPLIANVKGKRVLVVDDSMVRGTTTQLIIKNLKASGAKEVHVRFSSPPFRHVCHYGTDVDSEENLIANQLTMEEILRKIDADSLGFISIDGLKKACDKCRLDFCTACFAKDIS